MNWITVLGLAIDAIGATIVLAPGLPVLMGALDHFWRFKQIEAAKIKLYRQGCLDRSDPGFEQVARAIEQAGGWTKLPGEQLEKDAKTELRVELDDEVHHFEGEGYNLFEIERADDSSRYQTLNELEGRPPIALAKFDLKYRPSAADESGIPFIQENSPYIDAEMPGGELPRHIQDYKEQSVFYLGAALLLLGFIIQIFAQFV